MIKSERVMGVKRTIEDRIIGPILGTALLGLSSLTAAYGAMFVANQLGVPPEPKLMATFGAELLGFIAPIAVATIFANRANQGR